MPKLQTLKPKLQTVGRKVQAFKPGSYRIRGRALQQRRMRLWKANPYCAGCGRLVTMAYLSPQALAKWSPIKAESKDNTISILDVIGEDWWTGEGVTSKRIAGALRAIGDRDVVVNINSPGGDMFDGIAIYEQLRQHKGHVTVNVLGIAASAASIIAMAGDTINIGRPSFFMIHNCWCLAAGNRHDFADLVRGKPRPSGRGKDSADGVAVLWAVSVASAAVRCTGG